MESQRRIEIVGHYRYLQADPKDCKVCHNAKWATVLIDGICSECLLKKIEFLETEIKQLKQDYKDHTKILGDKLNDQIKYSKQDKEKIERLEKKIKELDIGLVARTLLLQENEKLQAVREAAENICKLEEQKDQPHLAHQGQGMDGFTLLVEYRGRTEKLRQALAKSEK